MTRVRVRGSGNLARFLVAIWVVALAMPAIVFLAAPLPSSEVDARDIPWLVAILSALSSLGLAGRAALVGCWLEGETIIVRSWWRTIRLPATSVQRVDVIGYEGWFNRFVNAWPRLWTIEIVADRAHELRALVAAQGSANRQATEVRRFVDSRLGRPAVTRVRGRHRSEA